jgi:predicted negative regulator of RcsB-dependent stress response
MAESGGNSDITVVSDVAEKKHKKIRLNIRYLYIALLGVLVVVTLAAIVVHFVDHNNKSTQNFANVNRLLLANNCSQQAQQSVSNLQPTTKDLSGSIALLNYKASCEEQNGNTTEAIATLKQLQHYYLLKGDASSYGSVQDEIKIYQNYPSSQGGSQ